MEIRSFLAFEFDEEIKRTVSLTVDEIRPKLSGVRWVRTENIHLTVVFMGGIDPSHVVPIGEMARDVCQNHGPFRVSLSGIGLFGTRRNPRVIWIGLDGDLEEMGALRDDLVKGLVPFGVKEEKRPFNPHLTLGRFRRGKRTDPGAIDKVLYRYRNLSSPVQTMTSLTMFRSDLRPDGPVYTRIGSWPVGSDL